MLPLVFPALVAGSIFTFSLTLGDYITPEVVSSTQFIGNVIYDNVGVANNLPLAAAYRVRADLGHGRLPDARAPRRRIREPVMVEGPLTRWLLRLGTGFVLAFIYFPLVVIGLYAFNDDITQAWPIQNWTTKWFTVAFHDPDVRDAFFLSVKAATLATLIALVLGTCLSFVIARYRFFGRETISFLVVLPIALPGHRHRASRSTRRSTPCSSRSGSGSGLTTIVIGHATFCIVVVYNNVIARLRRTSLSFEEASSDLGADSVQTFRLVTLPALGTALLAGGLLAFGLSFDEVIVTVFTAGSRRRSRSGSSRTSRGRTSCRSINVVALVVIVISIIPVWAAQKLAGPIRGWTRRRRWECAVARERASGRASSRSGRGRRRRA